MTRFTPTRLTPETSEKKSIRDWLRFKGWFVYHNLAGLGCYAGLADLTAIKGGVVVQVEVKAPVKKGKDKGKAGKQSFNQKTFQYEWEQLGGYYVCGDFDRIEAYINILENKDK